MTTHRQADAAVTTSCPKRRHLNLAVPAVLAALALLYSCGRSDTNTTFVDFSKKVAVQRPGDQPCGDNCLTVAVASMISARETAVHYHRLLDYIAARLGRKIRLVQRKTYGEINTLIGQGKIDLAFICSGPYISGRQKYGFEALAIPEVRGSHFYRSYLIVNRDSPFQTLEDLRGKTFAFTDPKSNTGKLVPTYWLEKRGETPEKFFGKVIYTYSHDNAIMAVALSLVDGAAVHQQIWNYYNDREPVFTSRTRIIRKSEPFGNPPVVVSARLPRQLKERMRRILYGMHLDREGKKILDELMIDRFVAAREEWYAPILTMQSVVAARNHAP